MSSTTPHTDIGAPAQNGGHELPGQSARRLRRSTAVALRRTATSPRCTRTTASRRAGCFATCRIWSSGRQCRLHPRAFSTRILSTHPGPLARALRNLVPQPPSTAWSRTTTIGCGPMTPPAPGPCTGRSLKKTGPSKHLPLRRPYAISTAHSYGVFPSTGSTLSASPSITLRIYGISVNTCWASQCRKPAITPVRMAASLRNASMVNCVSRLRNITVKTWRFIARHWNRVQRGSKCKKLDLAARDQSPGRNWAT